MSELILNSLIDVIIDEIIDLDTVTHDPQRLEMAFVVSDFKRAQCSTVFGVGQVGLFEKLIRWNTVTIQGVTGVMRKTDSERELHVNSVTTDFASISIKGTTGALDLTGSNWQIHSTMAGRESRRRVLQLLLLEMNWDIRQRQII